MSFKQTFVPVCLLALWPTIVHLSWAVIVYDCNAPDVGFARFSLTKELAQCPEMSSYSETRQDVQIFQREDARTVSVRSCLVQVTTTVHQCGESPKVPSGGGNKSADVYYLGMRDCNNLHQNRTFNIRSTAISGVKINETTAISKVLHGEIDSTGGCKGVTYYEDDKEYNNAIVFVGIIIEAHEYWLNVNFDKNEVILSDGNTCDYLDGYCLDPTYGEITWNITSTQNCLDRFTVLYSGVANVIVGNNNDTFLVIKTGEKLFALKAMRSFQMCTHSFYQTEHPKIIIMMGNTSLAKTTMPHLIKNQYLEVYSNSELTYVRSIIKISSPTPYHSDVIHRRCNSERQEWINTLSSAILFPHKLRSLINKRPGRIGRLTGDVLDILECVPRSGELTSSEQCYTTQPITVDGKDFFVGPSRILQAFGEEIDCNPITSSKFKSGNEWFTYSPGALKSTEPGELTAEVDSETLFDAKGLPTFDEIYTYEQKRKASKILMYGVQSENIERQLADALLGKSKTTTGPKILSKLTHPELKRTKSVGEKIYYILVRFGSISSLFLSVYVICLIVTKVVRLIIKCFKNSRMSRRNKDFNKKKKRVRARK